jgi:hypothetical protein
MSRFGGFGVLAVDDVQTVHGGDTYSDGFKMIAASVNPPEWADSCREAGDATKHWGPKYQRCVRLVT